MGFWGKTPPRRRRPWLERVLALQAAGDFDGAVSHARQALAKLDDDASVDSNELSACLNLLTRLIFDPEERASAEFRGLLERAVEVDSALNHPDHPMIAFHLRQLAQSHLAAGEPREAREVIERVIGMRERAIGLAHPDLILDLELLIVALRNEGRPREVISVCKRALTIQESASGPTSNEFAMMLARLALAFREMPDIDLEVLGDWYGQAIEILASKPRDQWPAELTEQIASRSTKEE